MADVSLQTPGGQSMAIPFFPTNRIGIEERAKSFTKRSIKKQSKLDALLLAISMVDLTTLEGADTEGKVRSLCAKAINPINDFGYGEILKTLSPSELKIVERIPSTAAVCVYPELVPIAVKALKGTNIQIASVSTAFPSGQLPLDLKLVDVERCIEFGATEIDMVINRGDFLSGRYQKVFDEIVAVKKVCEGKAHLKVILETSELVTYEKIRLASWLSMEAGADFIKTSTGKTGEGATMPITLVMLQAIADYHRATGKKIGMKPAGGIRTAKQAIHYLCMINETLGPEWLTPDLFRFGASTLLNDLLKQVLKQITGKYYYTRAFAID